MGWCKSNIRLVIKVIHLFTQITWLGENRGCFGRTFEVTYMFVVFYTLWNIPSDRFTPRQSVYLPKICKEPVIETSLKCREVLLFALFILSTGEVLQKWVTLRRTEVLKILFLKFFETRIFLALVLRVELFKSRNLFCRALWNQRQLLMLVLFIWVKSF